MVNFDENGSLIVEKVNYVIKHDDLTKEAIKNAQSEIIFLMGYLQVMVSR